MSARLACFSMALAAVATFSVSSPAKATEICDQQFKQCTSNGTPTYKCEQLRQLCESMYSVRPQPLVPSDRSLAMKNAWTDRAVAQPHRAPAAP